MDEPEKTTTEDVLKALVQELIAAMEGKSPPGNQSTLELARRFYARGIIHPEFNEDQIREVAAKIGGKQ